MNTISTIINIQEGEKVREVYRESKGLFGLIRKETVVKTDSLGKIVNIHIPALQNVDSVFINGDRWARKAPLIH